MICRINILCEKFVFSIRGFIKKVENVNETGKLEGDSKFKVPEIADPEPSV